MPSRLPADVQRLLEPVKLLVLDVDGVLTDGSLVYTAQGELTKTFHVRDGLIIRLLQNLGIQVGIITGRRTEALTRRCADLDMDEELVVQASKDKVADLIQMAQHLGVERSQIAAMGDDLPDLPVLLHVGFSACPADAAPEVLAACHLVCGAPGGHGAVRELGELILKAQDLWTEHTARWIRLDASPARDKR